MPRASRDDWQPPGSLGAADPTIPVVHLEDPRAMHRDAVVLFSDEDRFVHAQLIEKERRRLERGEQALERRPLWETRATVVAAVFMALGWVTGMADLIYQVVK